jgi:hypothetical protein
MERYIHTYIHTDKVTWLFFSAYAIISFALRARNYVSCRGKRGWMGQGLDGTGVGWDRGVIP